MSRGRNKFTQGYVCAVAVLAKHTDPLNTDVLDVLACECPTLERALVAGVDESDIETLGPAWEELQQRRERYGA